MKNTETTNNPINKKSEVQESNDEHIDQDFENYPHNPSSESQINPKTKEDKITSGNNQTKAERGAEADNTDKTKLVKPHDENESGNTGSTSKSFATTDFPGNEKDKHNETDEIQSDGSGGAFNETENVEDAEARNIDEK